MLKKVPLRIRFTFVASLFLFLSCVTLMLLSNMSAEEMIQAATVLPSINADSAPTTPLVPAMSVSDPYYHIFQQKTAIATILIVLVGSVATYFASGYILMPIRNLSNEVQKRDIKSLDKPIDIPQSADEIRQLTISFNQMMADLQHSFLLQKEFSANAAHELRTPLAIMRAKLDIFAMSENNNLKVMELIGSMDGQLERLSKLIEDLLWFSKDLPLEKTEPVFLHPLISDIAEELSTLAAEKEITINFETNDCFVLGQDRLLERVFYNLLENAVKYSPPHTEVKVTAKRRINSIQVEVSDQGEGIPKDCQASIFEPFYRVDKSRSRTIGGNGLGLAVCKRILERHHAQICVLPNHPKGSVFQITFPS